MSGNRIDRTVEIVRAVMNDTLRKNESVCHTVIDFSNDAYVNPPILNKQQLSRFRLPVPMGLTELNKALELLYQQLVGIQSSQDIDIYVILISDGHPTSSIEAEVEKIWNLMQYQNAQKYAVAIYNDTLSEIFTTVLGTSYRYDEIKKDTDYYYIAQNLWGWIKGIEIPDKGNDKQLLETAWINTSIVAYSGDKSYAFVSYAHADKREVLPIISHVIHSGYRIWYDDGIDPGTDWDDNIARHVQECSFFIAFISRNYIESDNCRDELNFARDLKKERLLIYLEDVELPIGMAMRLNRLQAIYWYTYKDKQQLYEKLFGTSHFELCKKIAEDDQDSKRINSLERVSSSVYPTETVIDEKNLWLKEMSDTAVALGSDVENNKLVSIDLCTTRSIAIYGKKGFGKSNLLSVLLEGAMQVPNVRFVLWDDGRNTLLQNEVVAKMVNSNENDIHFIHSEEEFVEYLEKNGYYHFPTRRRSLFILDDDSDADDQPPLLARTLLTENPFTIFIIHNRMFYRNDSQKELPLLQKLAPYIIDERFENKLFIFSDVQNILDVEMRKEFNNYIEHAFLLDDITRFVNGKGQNSIFGYLDIRELMEKYQSGTTQLGEGYHYDYEADEVKKVKFF